MKKLLSLVLCATTLAQQDFDRAYESPLSGVLANYVYNSLLTGRPYLLQMIEDVEIAARFARLRLNATDISITATGDAYTLAHDAADVLPGLRLLPDDNGHVLSWAQLVKDKQEVWPVQYILPGGAYVRSSESFCRPARPQVRSRCQHPALGRSTYEGPGPWATWRWACSPSPACVASMRSGAASPVGDTQRILFRRSGDGGECRVPPKRIATIRPCVPRT